MKEKTIFPADQRVKLGIWGLGRGQSFIRAAGALNMDIVAGCDFHQGMRESFRQHCPDALLTADEDEFLACGLDAVLIATYCPDHARHAIKALDAGIHVLSEVTAFMTPAEGVALVEAVERSGKVYNLAENYPFTAANMYLAKLWREGFFGDLAYAEYEYVHGVGRTYANPEEPGNRVHHWRGWLNYHYYCTHSLGPVMVITGLRPEAVVAYPQEVQNYGVIKGRGREVDGILPSLGAFAPSLIRMSNGGVMRNLMGGTTADSHHQRLFGTKASAEMPPLCLKVGATGSAMPIRVDPPWPELGDWAEQAGHGGGDFWVIYYFMRQILTGEKAPWDIYASTDATLAGIQALRSSEAGGVSMEVPDFRAPSVREQYRHDHWLQKHIDPVRIFPDDQDLAVTGDFSAACRALDTAATGVRKALDAMTLYPAALPEEQARIIHLVKDVRDAALEYAKIYARARRIVDAYPDSQGGHALRELLEDVGEEKRVMRTDTFIAELNDWLLRPVGERKR